MKLYLIDEPELEFGRAAHVCPRAGISKYDVYDTAFEDRRDKVRVGSVGTSDNLVKLEEWLDRCSRFIPSKVDAKQPNLFPPFFGFNPQSGFKASLIFGGRMTRTLNNSDIKNICKMSDWNRRVEEAVELFYPQIRFLSRHRGVDTIVCTIPDELYDKVARDDRKPVEETLEESEARQQDDILEANFRRALKAKAMHLGKPLQLVRETSLSSGGKGQQDDATRAWNFCTALYYKASQTVPWRMISNINRPLICYVGIGFYRSRDRRVVHTSLAQIFDELGRGVILRGKTPVETDSNGRPHMTEEQAYNLLRDALEEYKLALGTSPGRLVLHKSSNYDEAEITGLKEAIAEMHISTVDFITIMDTDYRLLRENIYPPYRGTHIDLDPSTHLLYTRGAVKYFRTYTGKYIPQPLEVRIVESGESPGVICAEILSLTKMNWNNTQFDGKYPITIGCARRVGQIMKYLEEDDPEPQTSYSFYM